MRKLLTLICSFIVMSSVLVIPCMANSNYYENENTGFVATVLDDADLLSYSEEQQLLEDMEPITEYGDVVFYSTDNNPYSTEAYAEFAYSELCSYESGTIFLIDMDNRVIYIYSEGDIYDVVTEGYATSITDNVYTYASDGDYYECAAKAFSQINTLLDGGNISQPMKIISSALLSLIIGCIITYIIVRNVSKPKTVNTGELKTAIYAQTNIYNTRTHFLGQTRVYDPPSSSGGGRGGGGGGGSRGGGGGHRF